MTNSEHAMTVQRVAEAIVGVLMRERFPGVPGSDLLAMLRDNNRATMLAAAEAAIEAHEAGGEQP